MRVETADISLVGGRDDNQDRTAVAVTAESVLLVVSDGMGGHSDGALAAETTVRLLVEAFDNVVHPIADPMGFLHLTLGKAHQAVAKLGSHLPLDQRPRATVAVCLVQGDTAWWAHIGDSRIYHFRQGAVLHRTRDHSHVEFLIREGVITDEQAQAHPMRNFVECCIGGEAWLPEMSIGGMRRLRPGDAFLLCSDGLWGSMDESLVAALFTRAAPGALPETLKQLGIAAVAANGPNSDNTSGAALRWLGPL